MTDKSWNHVTFIYILNTNNIHIRQLFLHIIKEHQIFKVTKNAVIVKWIHFIISVHIHFIQSIFLIIRIHYILKITPYLCTNKLIFPIRDNLSLRRLPTYSQYIISQNTHIWPNCLWMVALHEGSSLCWMRRLSFVQMSSRVCLLQALYSNVHLALWRECNCNVFKLACNSLDKGKLFSGHCLLASETLQDLFRYCFPFPELLPGVPELVCSFSTRDWSKCCISKLGWNSRRSTVQS